MNRELIFRGKRVDNGKWIEGYLYSLSEQNSPFIMLKGRSGESHEVDPGTVSQYTGLKDKNGLKIWEGDIVQRNIFGEDIMGEILWNDTGGTGFYLKRSYLGGARFYSIGRGQYDDDDNDLCNDVVIGNIYENPELVAQ